MSQIALLWNDIEEYLADIAPTVLPTLNPPATDQELDFLENETGLVVPREFRESLQIHNGQHDPSRLELLTGHGTLLSCEAMVRTWHMLGEILDDVGPIADGSEWWNKSYLPIADYEGDCLCIDLTSKSYGTIHSHIHDSTIKRSTASNLADWLTQARDVFKYRRYDDSPGFIDFWTYDLGT